MSTEAPGAPAATSCRARARPSSGRVAPPLIIALAGIGITVAVLANVAHGRGFFWLLIPALAIARRLSYYCSVPRR